METRAHGTNKTTTNANLYECIWSEDYHDNFKGTMKEILTKFSDLHPDEEEWFMWDYLRVDQNDVRQYATGGGVTLDEFDKMSTIWDKAECDNMVIVRVA